MGLHGPDPPGVRAAGGRRRLVLRDRPASGPLRGLGVQAAPRLATRPRLPEVPHPQQGGPRLPWRLPRLLRRRLHPPGRLLGGARIAGPEGPLPLRRLRQALPGGQPRRRTGRRGGAARLLPELGPGSRRLRPQVSRQAGPPPASPPLSPTVSPPRDRRGTAATPPAGARTSWPPTASTSAWATAERTGSSANGWRTPASEGSRSATGPRACIWTTTVDTRPLDAINRNKAIRRRTRSERRTWTPHGIDQRQPDSAGRERTPQQRGHR